MKGLARGLAQGRTRKGEVKGRFFPKRLWALPHRSSPGVGPGPLPTTLAPEATQWGWRAGRARGAGALAARQLSGPSLPLNGPGSAGGSEGSALRGAANGKFICGPGLFCTSAPGFPALASGMLNLSRPPRRLLGRLQRCSHMWLGLNLQKDQRVAGTTDHPFVHLSCPPAKQGAGTTSGSSWHLRHLIPQALPDSHLLALPPLDTRCHG